MSEKDKLELVEHRGGCHCGGVTWKVLAPPDLTGSNVDQTELLLNFCFLVIHCNCSVCEMKQNHHFIVPRERFVLETGTSLISTYTFNTHAAKSGHFIYISQLNVNIWNLDINSVLSVEFRVSMFQDQTRTELV